MHDEWDGILGSGDGRTVHRSAPVKSGGEPYWYAAARILPGDNRSIRDAAIALKGPIGLPRRLYIVEQALMDGRLENADAVLDAVKELVECDDDEYGSAAIKSYIAGWLCADVVGRCLE